MSKEEIFEVKGKVTEVNRNGMCKVEIIDTVFIEEGEEPKARTINALTSGKMRNFKIKILKGDSVIIQLTPYDPNKGRIIFREKSNKNNNNNSILAKKNISLTK